jgi:hypothetical protein
MLQIPPDLRFIFRALCKQGIGTEILGKPKIKLLFTSLDICEKVGSLEDLTRNIFTRTYYRHPLL